MELVKLLLIDLDTRKRATRGKQVQTVQPERLSAEALRMEVKRQSDLPYNKRSGRGESEAVPPGVLLRVTKCVKLIGWAGNLTTSGAQFQGILSA
jgi:hypothetical protein